MVSLRTCLITEPENILSACRTSKWIGYFIVFTGGRKKKKKRSEFSRFQEVCKNELKLATEHSDSPSRLSTHTFLFAEQVFPLSHLIGRTPAPRNDREKRQTLTIQCLKNGRKSVQKKYIPNQQLCMGEKERERERQGGLQLSYNY